MRDFFAFRTMLIPLMIKLVYPLGLIAITLAGALTIALAFVDLDPRLKQFTSQAGWPTGLLIIIVGNLAWRLACEQVIVFFAIHEALVRGGTGGGGDKPSKKK